MNQADISDCVSQYARENSAEMLAEAFVNMKGGKPNELGMAMERLLKEEM